MMNWKVLGPTHRLAQGASLGQPVDQRDANEGDVHTFLKLAPQVGAFFFVMK